MFSTTEEQFHNAFFDAYWTVELPKLPSPREFAEWFVPHNQFVDALGMYCAGGEL